MEKNISCCGMICSDCEYYSADCLGCEEIPCSRNEKDDPTKTKEENAAEHYMQMKQAYYSIIALSAKQAVCFLRRSIQPVWQLIHLKTAFNLLYEKLSLKRC